MQNTKIVLVNRPTADIDPEVYSGKGTFLLKKEPVPELKADEFLVQVLYLSVDPAMRGYLRLARSYMEPVKIDEVMRSGGICKVVKTGASITKVKVGDLISGYPGWQQYAVFTEKSGYVLLENLPAGVSPSLYLGVLGDPGLTAYFGLNRIGEIKAGQTVVVSGAAGAVGVTACQLAKLKGCKVYGIAGGQKKCDLLKAEYGLDGVVDYKSKDFVKDVKSIGYIDVYFDNVGGNILDLMLTRLNKNARVINCGAISDYNNPNPKGLRGYMNLISQRARMEGFIVFDFIKDYGQARAEIIEYLKKGQLKTPETTLKGLDNAPTALVGLFHGANTGKMIVDCTVAAAESKL